MNRMLFIGAVASLAMLGFAKADPVDPSAYVDENGFINVQALTCAQLANTYQEDANALMAWYSGWYNGLAKKHYIHVTRAKLFEHEVILYCKAHPDVKIIAAIDVLLKEERLSGAYK